MPDLFAYLEGFGTGESFTKSVIIVTDLPTGSTVTATKGEAVETATEKDGKWWLKNLDLGEWTLKAVLGNQSATTKFNIEQFGVYYVSMAYSLTPEFTYTGDYEIVQDNDTPISDFANWKGDWKVRFLTSGTLTPVNLNGFDGYIDIFMAGAGNNGGVSSGSSKGGGGAGSGYTKTVKRVKLEVGNPIEIVVGAPGGGETSAFGYKAAGGKPGTGTSGGNGGTGGNGGGEDTPISDGDDGIDGEGTRPGGKGQKSSPGPNGETGSTREFGEPDGKLYAYGGISVNESSSPDQPANSANGGTGTKSETSKGGSGIVIIRNAREAA